MGVSPAVVALSMALSHPAPRRPCLPSSGSVNLDNSSSRAFRLSQSVIQSKTAFADIFVDIRFSCCSAAKTKSEWRQYKCVFACSARRLSGWVLLRSSSQSHITHHIDTKNSIRMTCSARRRRRRYRITPDFFVYLLLQSGLSITSKRIQIKLFRGQPTGLSMCHSRMY